MSINPKWNLSQNGGLGRDRLTLAGMVSENQEMSIGKDN